MFQKEIINKNSRDNRYVGIYLYPTSQCNTGCYHCLDNSNCENPVNFTEKLAQKVVEEARKEKCGLSVLLTGLGEPLMTPELVEIVDVFEDYEELISFSITTSGFLDNELERKQKFEALLKKAYKIPLMVNQSFNLYHESFSERFMNTARMTMNLMEMPEFYVRLCASANNLLVTQGKLETAMKNLAKELQAKIISLPIGYKAEEIENFRVFENRSIEDETTYLMYFEAFANPQWHVLVSNEKILAILVEPVSFDRMGRGKKIPHRPWVFHKCPTIYEKSNSLTICPDGSVFSDDSCYTSKHMKLGKIGENSFAEMLHKKHIFSNYIMQALLADKRMYKWGTQEVCTLCKQVVAKGGLGLA